MKGSNCGHEQSHSRLNNILQGRIVKVEGHRLTDIVTDAHSINGESEGAGGVELPSSESGSDVKIVSGRRACHRDISAVASSKGASTCGNCHSAKGHADITTGKKRM